MAKKVDIVNLACNIVSEGLSDEEIIDLIENLSMIVFSKSPGYFSKVTNAIAYAYECNISCRLEEMDENEG